MAPIIYLVRHAEAEHNISKDFTIRDPPLTTVGKAQASTLAATLPEIASIAVVITSPLTRTLQTTIAGFPHLARGGEAGGAQLIIDPDLQERSNLPCDTGSERAELEKAFPHLDLGHLGEDWLVKEGLYAADDGAVAKRAQRFRDRLHDIVTSLSQGGDRDGGEGRGANIVVVTHGVFMKFLAEDQSIDLPKAGWKAFGLGNREGGGAVLVAQE
ncbi:hypothetical protein D7B24_004793 [Verticillium nonalfalfae]|uniref:Phosphoglycerate mutase n=1 Tax=Verticillium nonalfalfae TaxID=1051616 RepID=A0A3M9YE18_9PEZI|nr:uncharacterized protein D7B24_004793 [Verticillium nonalfalfae]RNJ58341.1 hypothetical protein D7B24_004793 [Verticillium nonalfalfae]